MSKFFGPFIVLWVIVFVVSFFTASEDITFGARVLYTAIMAGIGAIGFGFGDSEKPAPRKSKSNMISCPKCGFLGVGYGFCPKCGSTIVNKIDN